MPAQTALDITLNGEAKGVAPGMTIAGVVRMLQLDPQKPRGVAVAVNDEVVRKEEWRVRSVREGDRIEVITARQGG